MDSNIRLNLISLFNCQPTPYTSWAPAVFQAVAQRCASHGRQPVLAGCVNGSGLGEAAIIESFALGGEAARSQYQNTDPLVQFIRTDTATGNKRRF